MSKTSNLQLDGNKMLHHLDRVQEWQLGEDIFPIYIAFSPSSLCNHKCNFCVYHYKEFEPIYFPKLQYLSLVDEWKEHRVKSIFFAGDGEPLLNKDSVEMIEYTRASGIDIAMNTNGRLISKSNVKSLVTNLSWIRISLNAGSEDSYGDIHGTSKKDFEVVMNNLQLLVDTKEELKSSITIGVQCVLLDQNKNEIELLAKRLKEIGVSYLSIKPFLKHPGTKFNDVIQDRDKVLARLQKLESLNDDDFMFILRMTNFSNTFKRDYKQCLSGEFMLEIDARGDVYSCGPFIGDKRHCYGNVLADSFETMWNSERKKKVLSYIQNELNVCKCMPFCRPDSVNKFLWELKKPPEHVNFI
ncbi:radical SAM/SPASM domain-containing protein [Halobacteriovorax sp. HLS]|uniref:radical SAM/SPASM domain-containing protein n=1 Tax=Halobacteriovorax sp. HLS TaxID=2234000 RepID=UPI000FDBFE55|nr:radical SAM protein [Halobacteriovorax sp. HLS]